MGLDAINYSKPNPIAQKKEDTTAQKKEQHNADINYIAKALSDGNIDILEANKIKERYGNDGLGNILQGKAPDEVIAELKDSGMDDGQINELLKKIKNNTLKNIEDSRLKKETMKQLEEYNKLQEKEINQSEPQFGL